MISRKSKVAIRITVSSATGLLAPASQTSTGSVADVLINNYLDGQQACYFAIVPSGPTSGYLYLVDDNDDTTTYVPGSPLTVSSTSSGSLQNSQCTVTPVPPQTGASPISLEANWLSFTVSIKLKSAFAGNRGVWAAGIIQTTRAGKPSEPGSFHGRHPQDRRR